MKVLSIGNSFSQDAQRYLHRISVAEEGEVIECTNLYIGGCSLETHHKNLMANAPLYELEINGRNTLAHIDIVSALKSDKWDVVTLQQVSSQSPNFETYQPHLNVLAWAVRKYAPDAKLYIHQTWAYEQGSERLCTELGYADQHDMFAEIENAYDIAAKEICADGIIRDGQAMITAIDDGIGIIHRDTFHAGFAVGRYMLGLVWYMTLTGQKAIGAPVELDAPHRDEPPATAERLERAVAAACKAVGM